MKPIFTFLMLWATQIVFAQWSSIPSVNNAICNFSGNQTNVQMVSDGAGGALLTWQDARNGTNDIYAQRIDANGSLQWPADGVAICTAAADQYAPKLSRDDAGGAIITWYDNRNGNYDIYAQRINISGIVQWIADGVAICTVAGNQNAQQIVADGSGGAVIVWSDGRSGNPNADILAQRINGSGTVQWTVGGVSVCNASSLQNIPQLISDGAGGAIICWEDWRNFSQADIYTQRISSNGFTNWSFNGVPICTETSYHQYNTKIVSDGAGGAIICWQDNRNNYSSGQDLYSQRINATGATQWTGNGVAVCNAPSLQTAQQIIADGSGGAILVWEDRRVFGAKDIYSQRLNTAGVVQWAANGVAICNASANQEEPQLAGGEAGGAIIVWSDSRNNYQQDIYAQCINSTGSILWTSDGVPVTNEEHAQFNAQLISDGAGGGIIAWQDARAETDYDIYSSKLFNSGVLPVKLVSFTATIQNRNTLLRWQTSNEQDVANFNVQRSTDGNRFTTINTVSSPGNSAIGSIYNYIDYSTGSLQVNQIYYRLQIVDKDGQTTYSTIVAVKPDADMAINIAPNPVTNYLTISCPEKIQSINLLNTKGQTLVRMVPVGVLSQYLIDVKKLPPGNYLIQAVGENQVWIKQFIKL